jgi:hypothetical protein
MIHLQFCDHPVGYYDTPEEAVNKVWDRLFSVFGETENLPSEYLANLSSNRF